MEHVNIACPAFQVEPCSHPVRLPHVSFPSHLAACFKWINKPWHVSILSWSMSLGFLFCFIFLLCDRLINFLGLPMHVGHCPHDTRLLKQLQPAVGLFRVTLMIRYLFAYPLPGYYRIISWACFLADNS